MGRFQLFEVPADRSGPAALVRATGVSQNPGSYSPDGRTLAYCANESGRPEVFVKAFPGPGPRVQVSSGGGTDPVWRRDGRELFYRSGDRMMTVPVSSEGTLSAGRAQELWKGPYSHGASSSCGAPTLTSSNYDVTADGQRFIMIGDDDIEAETSRQIIVVQRWADEVPRLAPRA